MSSFAPIVISLTIVSTTDCYDVNDVYGSGGDDFGAEVFDGGSQLTPALARHGR